MKIIEALENALALLQANGYVAGGAIYDDLVGTIRRLRTKYPEVAEEEL